MLRPRLLLLPFTVFACSTTTVVAPPTTGDSPPATTTPAAASGCTSDEQCAMGKETCDVSTNTCVAIALGKEIGTGDGTPQSVTLTEIYAAPTKGAELVDLAFNPKDPTQLWAVGYGDDSTHVGSGVTTDSKGTWKAYVDPAAMHFMHKPPALAMGASPFWGVCGDNDNSQNDPSGASNFFMGPSMMTTDLTIFAKDTAGGLGSHYDMLHNTSFCRGIAHVDANWYWVFNGELGSLDKYNFAKPHQPGGDDHSDGEIYRYAAGQLRGADGVPSHIFYDATDSFLYVADTGNKRVVRLDTTKGQQGGALPRRNEVLAKNAVMTGTTVEEIVPAGTLEQPSGLEVKDDLIYVTDTATSSFHVFDKTGKEVRKLDTGLPPKSLAGFTFGPDGKIWLVDRGRSKVLRIDPQ